MIGHQLDHNNGAVAGGVAGALIGGSIGNQMDYQDQQITTQQVATPPAVGIASVVDNVGASTIYGFELEGSAFLMRLDNRALLAIQGPEAAEVMAAHEPVLAEMGFMECARLMLFGCDCFVSRSGYTGEDGYEISVPAEEAERIWNTLLEDARVKPIGLGARDSLRLEAGLPLHGHDIDAFTSPVEAALGFALSKSRREAGNFNGAERVAKEMAEGPSRVRVGLAVKEGAPAREGAEVADADGQVIGKVTSGGPSPTLGRNIAMAYVPARLAALGTELKVIVRGKPAAAEVVAMPFVAQRYYRKPKA